MNKSTFFFFLFFCCCCGNLKSQDGEDDFIASEFKSYYFNPQNIGLSDPQVTDFVKYGNLNVDYYNGLLDMEIPLDGYQDNDFELPISLKYISNGFIPSKRPSIVGYNWFLNFGGVVSRTVKGSPDDVKGNHSQYRNEYLKDGLLVATRNGHFKEYSKKDLLDLKVDITSWYNYVLGDFKYDMEPDIFNFSFGKHSGSFILGNEGKVVSLSGEGYVIDLDGMATQEYSTTEAPKNSTIVIITPDGYRYEFGGTTDYLEYFIPNNPARLAKKPRHITSWFLRTIQAPNNRKVEFVYTSKELARHYYYFLYSSSLIRISGGCGWVPPSSSSSAIAQIEVKDQIFCPIIKKVTIDNTEIQFNTTQGSCFFTENDYSSLLYNISFYVDSKKRKETSFDYQSKGKYSFLHKIVSDDKKHEFNYNLDSEFPEPLTVSLDHWGYWNGENTLKVEDVAIYCQNIASIRNTSPGFHDVGLLTEVKYPTGGNTKIFYEPNYYSRYVEKKMGYAAVYLADCESDTICGGARICKIEDYDPINNKTYSSRRFEYIRMHNYINSKPSGIINTKPKYKIEEIVNKSYLMDNCVRVESIRQTDISANTLGFNENIPENHISYSHIIERFDDNSHNYYEYTNHDYYSSGNSTNDIKIEVATYPSKDPHYHYTNLSHLEIAEKSHVYVTSDRSRNRGKLQSKVAYDSLGKLVRSESYGYYEDEEYYDYEVALVSNHRGMASYKIYTNPILPNAKYIRENGVLYEEQYKYKNKSILTERKIKLDTKLMLERYLDYLFLSIQYKYVTDYEYSSLNDACKELLIKNIINLPLEITKVSYIGRNPDKTLETIQFNYKLNDSRPVLADVKVNRNDQWTKIIEYPRYNEYDYPIHVIEKENLHTVYLRGYQGQRILAKIVNATHDEVDAARNSINLSSQSLTDSYDLINNNFQKVNQLRDLLPKAQVSIYTYYPLIGIKSVTDPRGISTHYSYDNTHRLKERYYKNPTNLHDLEYMLESYEYNYAD